MNIEMCVRCKGIDLEKQAENFSFTLWFCPTCGHLWKALNAINLGGKKIKSKEEEHHKRTLELWEV